MLTLSYMLNIGHGELIWLHWK